MLDGYKTFRCPNCKEMVNNTMQICKHCSAPLDEQAITASVEKQERINSAYNAASNVRILAGVMWIAFFFSLLPFIGIIGGIGFYLAFVGVPVFLIIWLVRFGSVDRKEPDMNGVTRTLLMAFGLWVLFPVLYIGLLVLVFAGAVAYEVSR